MEKTIFSRHNKQFCLRLREIREGAGLTQRELGKKLSRAHTFVTKCELGERRVDLVEFYWICKACGVAPEKEMVKLIKAFNSVGKKKRK